MNKMAKAAVAVLVLAVCLYAVKFFAAGSGQGAVVPEKPLNARNESESVAPSDVSEPASEESRAYKETETETESKPESTTEQLTETDAAQEKAKPETAAQEKAKAEAAAQGQTAQQAGGEATVVNRVYIEDCGLDTGYWEITYSDGRVEHVED